MEGFFSPSPHPKSSGFVSLTLQLFNLGLLKKKEKKSLDSSCLSIPWLSLVPPHSKANQMQTYPPTDRGQTAHTQKKMIMIIKIKKNLRK